MIRGCIKVEKSEKFLPGRILGFCRQELSQVLRCEPNNPRYDVLAFLTPSPIFTLHEITHWGYRLIVRRGAPCVCSP